MSIRPLSPALAEKARVELNEDPSRLKDDLQHLKDWIAKQPHLRARTDDQWLVAFLRGSKFSLERAKEKIDLYYTLRTIAPELSNTLKASDPKFKEIMALGSYLVLPKSSDPTAPRTVLMRPGVYDPTKYSPGDVMAISFIMGRIILNEDDTFVVAGGQSIMDLEGTTLAHFTQMNPTTMKKMVAYGQDAMPIRMKGSHILNTSPAFETLFNIMKNLLNEKNRRRTHVHNKNLDALYKHIPKEILPAEYGGNAGTIQEITDYWIKKVEEYGPWLEEDLQFGTDESKRLGAPKTAEAMFGLEGSFRQLQFD